METTGFSVMSLRIDADWRLFLAVTLIHFPVLILALAVYQGG